LKEVGRHGGHESTSMEGVRDKVEEQGRQANKFMKFMKCKIPAMLGYRA